MRKSREGVEMDAVPVLLNGRDGKKQIPRQARDDRWSSDEMGNGAKEVGVGQT